MKRSIIRLSIIALLLPCIAAAKTPPPNDTIQAKILNAINVFYQAYPHEQIHLQFDKNRYMPGDNIWFKSFLLPFHDTTYSSISKIEYVELIDENNLLVKRLVLPVENGTAQGHFKLNDGFGEGVYHVRAYTAWMLNFDSAFFFNRDLPVFAHDKPLVNPVSRNFTLSFCPEGGSLVWGLTSQVAYKATDENGNPVVVSGKLMDDKGNTRALLQTGPDGLGSFIIHPEEGFTYSVTAQLGNGVAKILQLPAIKKSGVVLHIVDKPDSVGNSKLYFHIARSKADKQLYSSVIICAHTSRYNRMLAINFDPSYAGDYNDTILVAADPLELENEGDNIAHVTVFNNSGDVLADRMVFLHDGKQMAASMQASINVTANNEFTLYVPGDEMGQYAVSVTQVSDALTNDESNVLSDFRLPAINNYTYQPSAYFKDTSRYTGQRLNLLLLTNKWDYFDWKNVLANKYEKIKYLPEQALVLKGNVAVEKNGKKETYTEPSIPLMMKAEKDSVRTFLNVPVSSTGSFVEPHLYFHDTAIFYYQGNVQKSKKTIIVTFDKTETDSILALPFYYKPYRNVKYVAGHKTADALYGNPVTEPGNLVDSGNLKAVTVNAKAKSRIDSLDEVYTSGIFSGTRNFIRTFDLTDDKIAENDYSSNVLQYLQGRVPGLTITGNIQLLPQIYWRLTAGLLTSNMAVDPIAATILNMPIFFIDGRQVNSNDLSGNANREQLTATMSQLTSVKVADIAYIKVYEPGTFYGASGGSPHGAVAIYLKKGYNSNSSINAVNRAGFSYIPAFTGDNNGQTIYWNPEVLTNPQTHIAKISFPNAAGIKKYKIVVEGFDKKGRLYRVEKIVGQ